MQPIERVAERLDVPAEALLPYGRDKAKLGLELLGRARGRAERPRLVLVSAITPTPAGEGKTTTAIGLADALEASGRRACVALREPSAGPCMGIKGGGTGGGESTLVPADAINLHFTGDFHAITAAHNLLAAVVDNHLHFATDVGLDGRRVLWPRVLDVNDRALRSVTLGLGGPGNGVPREGGFDITAASELMAVLCLAEGEQDLRERIDRILVGFTREREPVHARDLRATGAMMALLREAMLPNLVQSRHGTPALVHGGPFANIAHGCNSLVATRMGLQLADWVVTEAGFGFDLGAEKFFDIKCRASGLDVDAVVLVATIRALKMHGGRPLDALAEPDPGAVAGGLANLDKHVDNIRCFGQTPVVALNAFPSDSPAEVAVVREHCEAAGLPFSASDHYERGPDGAAGLAERVVEAVGGEATPVRFLYELDAPVQDKIRAVATTMYGADDVVFTRTAERDLRQTERLGHAGLPVCIAKTQSSLSDDPKLRGRPRDFVVTVREIGINAGAGFLVVLTGDVLRMPGLPRQPRSERIDLRDGEIVGLE